MRDHDRPANDQGDIKGFKELFIAHARSDTLIDVVRDAIITAEHHRGAQSQQLFGFHIQCTRFVGLGIERKEPLGDGGPASEDFLVELAPECFVLFV